MVSTSMPLKPKALSPSMAITGSPDSTAAATAKPMPMPITPQVPTSRRLRGLYMSTMERVKSSALAPSLTSIASGLALTMSRTTFSALWKFIGFGSLASVSAILATFLLRRSQHGVQPLGRRLAASWLPMPASSADTQEPMSPTSGASMRTLLSASVGEMSIWMNFCAAPGLVVLAAPGLALAVRQQPVQPRADQQHHVGLGQHVGARRGRRQLVRVGQQALGHRHRQVGDAGASRPARAPRRRRGRRPRPCRAGSAASSRP